MPNKQIRTLVMSELLSPAKATKELKTKYKVDTIKAIHAVQLVQDFLGKDSIASEVVTHFESDNESAFVKFIASQLPDSQSKTINGANLFGRIVAVAKRTKIK